jgi:D-arabinose 1-dehydrogenase-like Zn-dependent alcohol dehydrogenase
MKRIPCHVLQLAELCRDKEGNRMYGGYSTHILCKERFVLRISREMHEASTAPLLCAGITIYEPMVHYGAHKRGMRVGVVGLGGLGHMVVKFSKAFGQHCTVRQLSMR